MSDEAQITAEQQRVALARQVLKDQPKAVRDEFREAVLGGVVMPGMTPFEAKLAGGAFSYQVKVDPAVWPEQANPLAVLWAQTERPDASFIRMNFKNRTQFSSATATAFSVVFEQGKAKEIKAEGT